MPEMLPGIFYRSCPRPCAKLAALGRERGAGLEQTRNPALSGNFHDDSTL
jgi:hypothetical protein